MTMPAAMTLGIDRHGQHRIHVLRMDRRLHGHVPEPVGHAERPAHLRGDVYADRRRRRRRRAADRPALHADDHHAGGREDPGRWNRLRGGRHGLLRDHAGLDDAGYRRDAERRLRLRRLDGRLLRDESEPVGGAQRPAHLRSHLHAVRRVRRLAAGQVGSDPGLTPPVAARRAGVVPGTAAGSTGFGPNSYFAGDRSSFDVFIAHSHESARPGVGAHAAHDRAHRALRDLPALVERRALPDRRDQVDVLLRRRD
ncbi:MAG: hypothetical protein MZV64_42910 [Ignavibacteriales bacterium]|nr:hypothetical protein [Ignavibacteriales bacterium]